MSASTTNQNTVAFDDDDIYDEFVALDAEAAYHGVSSLVEMLGACKPGEKVTGIFVYSLLKDVQAHLFNVVDSLRVPVSMPAVQHQVQ